MREYEIDRRKQCADYAKYDCLLHGRPRAGSPKRVETRAQGDQLDFQYLLWDIDQYELGDADATGLGIFRV